jgi:2-amino-4-hydroxy-6-hydroxymethyldihydropteridine diphosphokinase
MRRAYLSLGSNLGDRRSNLETALEWLEKEKVHVLLRSSVYETEPQDVKSQPWFLNMVVLCETTCFPIQLLGLLQKVEREMGRVRQAAARRGPRLIDIDILLFGNAVMETSELVIPHPRMFDRRFVLEPLLEIAPELKHPETKEPISRYLSRVRDQKIRKL